jgi:hypothetical protein
MGAVSSNKQSLRSRALTKSKGRAETLPEVDGLANRCLVQINLREGECDFAKALSKIRS